MTMKNTYTFELNESQHEFLKQMVQKYDLPDVDKAIRCLINYSREQADKQDDVFQQIRCLDC